MGSQIIRIMTEVELEALQVETFINTTDRVTKVSDHSATRGLIRGNVRAGKMTMKDVALAVSHLFIDSASGSTLDEVADSHGISPRFTAGQSSTYVRLVADEGTVYQEGVNVVSDNKGNLFDLQEDLTISDKGFGYVKVRSQQSGASTKVDPYTLINISPEPVGHIGVLNEYTAEGGRDNEPDDEFRERIKQGPDILARGTLAYLTQAFITINPNVLRIVYDGINTQGKVVLSILTSNGIDLTEDELQTLLEEGGQYLSLTEMNPIGTQSYGVTLKNVDYYSIDVELRMELFVGADFEVIVKDIQQKFSKYVDFRFWNSFEDRVERTDLISIVKNTKGVKNVPDNYFIPVVDLTIPNNQFPRFRGFIAKDLDGQVIINQAGTIDPIFYPTEPDTNFSETVL